MARLSYRATDVISEHVGERVDQFDSKILSDMMHTLDDGDDLSAYFAEAIGNARYAIDEADVAYGWGDNITIDTESAADGLESRFDEHLDALVAKECALVAQRDLDWHDRSDDEIEAAVHEAREWLQCHEAAAKRADVWGKVTA